MILYLDTSSLAKLYFEEEDSGPVQRQIKSSKLIFSSVIAYPEMCSALSKRKREGFLKITDIKKPFPFLSRIGKKSLKFQYT